MKAKGGGIMFLEKQKVGNIPKKQKGAIPRKQMR